MTADQTIDVMEILMKNMTDESDRQHVRRWMAEIVAETWHVHFTERDLVEAAMEMPIGLRD